MSKTDQAPREPGGWKPAARARLNMVPELCGQAPWGKAVTARPLLRIEEAAGSFAAKRGGTAGAMPVPADWLDGLIDLEVVFKWQKKY